MASTTSDQLPMQDTSHKSPPGSINPATGRKKRIRNWTANDRAAHRVFERSRREAFKDSLTKLAAQIPTLQATDPNRLSKHIVVNESLSLHQLQKAQVDETLAQMKAVLAERDELLAEVNRWRAGAGVEPKQAIDVVPFDPIMYGQLNTLNQELDGWEDDSEEYEGVPLHQHIQHVGGGPVPIDIPPIVPAVPSNEATWDPIIDITNMGSVDMNLIDPITVPGFGSPSPGDDPGVQQLQPQTRTSNTTFMDRNIHGGYSFRVA